MRKFLVLAIAVVGLAACGSRDDRTGGPMVTRHFQVANFQDVELAGNYDVQIRTGAPVSVSAQGPENEVNRLRVDLDGNRLRVRPQNDSGWFHFGHRSSGEVVHVMISVPTLSGATLAGSGTINIDKLQGNSFEGTVAGSGDLQLASVALQSLKLNIAGSGSAKAGQGTAQKAEYEIAGSGDLDAAAVQAQQIKVSIAGSGGVKAHASTIAEVDIMGSGDVEISGGAKCTVNKAGSGTVRCS